MAICAATECTRPVTNFKNGLCRKHYLTHLDRQRPVCSIVGCTRPGQRELGVCTPHLVKIRRWGSIEAAPGRGSPGRPRRSTHPGRRLHSGGYWTIRSDDGRWVLEHRHVMESKLGRALLPGENVHHINGDRLDNRPENLELWVVRQPRGQRVEDALAWAHEIVARYGTMRSENRTEQP